MTFAPGDVVTLKSGGHSMTVVSVDEEEIDCLWVSDDGQLYRQSIPAIALTVVELTDIDEAEDEEVEAATAENDDDGDEDKEEDEEGEEEEDEEEEEEEEEEEDGEEDEEPGQRRAKRR